MLTQKPLELIKNSIRDVVDFPKPGIVFKDITTLLSNPLAFQTTVDLFVDQYLDSHVDYIATPESRGFIFGAPIACKLNAGLTLIRKPGKLPAKTLNVSYQLEYGSDTLCIHEDAFKKPGARVLIIDDLLATGGSCKASAELIRQAGGIVVGAGFVIELDFLNGREKLEKSDLEVFSLIHY